jgi:hypothetical protein
VKDGGVEVVVDVDPPVVEEPVVPVVVDVVLEEFELAQLMDKLVIPAAIVPDPLLTVQV